MIWATDSGDEILPQRPQDRIFRGNIVQAMIAYAEGKLGDTKSRSKRRRPHHRDRLGPHDERRPRGASHDAQAVSETNITAIGSINSPMQCMMKEVCAQCLQRHVNPHTGEEFFVFSCFNQDQHLDFVDFKNLNERLRANSIQEKLTNMWLDRAFGREDFKRLYGEVADQLADHYGSRFIRRNEVGKPTFMWR